MSGNDSNDQVTTRPTSNAKPNAAGSNKGTATGNRGKGNSSADASQNRATQRPVSGAKSNSIKIYAWDLKDMHGMEMVKKDDKRGMHLLIWKFIFGENCQNEFKGSLDNRLKKGIRGEKEDFIGKDKKFPNYSLSKTLYHNIQCPDKRPPDYYRVGEQLYPVSLIEKWANKVINGYENSIKSMPNTKARLFQIIMGDLVTRIREDDIKDDEDSHDLLRLMSAVTEEMKQLDNEAMIKFMGYIGSVPPDQKRKIGFNVKSRIRSLRSDLLYLTTLSSNTQTRAKQNAVIESGNKSSGKRLQGFEEGVRLYTDLKVAKLKLANLLRNAPSGKFGRVDDTYFTPKIKEVGNKITELTNELDKFLVEKKIKSVKDLVDLMDGYGLSFEKKAVKLAFGLLNEQIAVLMSAKKSRENNPMYFNDMYWALDKVTPEETKEILKRYPILILDLELKGLRGWKKKGILEFQRKVSGYKFKYGKSEKVQLFSGHLNNAIYERVGKLNKVKKLLRENNKIIWTFDQFLDASFKKFEIEKNSMYHQSILNYKEKAIKEADSGVDLFLFLLGLALTFVSMGLSTVLAIGITGARTAMIIRGVLIVSEIGATAVGVADTIKTTDDIADAELVRSVGFRYDTPSHWWILLSLGGATVDAKGLIGLRTKLPNVFGDIEAARVAGGSHLDDLLDSKHYKEALTEEIFNSIKTKRILLDKLDEIGKRIFRKTGRAAMGVDVTITKEIVQAVYLIIKLGKTKVDDIILELKFRKIIEENISDVDATKLKAGIQNLLLNPPVPKSPHVPTGYIAVDMVKSKLPRDTAKNIDTFPPNTKEAYVFEDGDSIWRDPNGTLRHDITVKAPIDRAGFEAEMVTSTIHGRKKVEKMIRAHTSGAGVGFESPYGIFYAPYKVNQTFQNAGIEGFLRQTYKELNHAGGESLHFVTKTNVHYGTQRLQRIEYIVEFTNSDGIRKPLFKYEITIDLNGAATQNIISISDPTKVESIIKTIKGSARMKELLSDAMATPIKK